jgi:hypothetical protein
VRNKARLLAQGFSQVKGLDFGEIFALIACLEAIRILLAFDTSKGFKLFVCAAGSLVPDSVPCTPFSCASSLFRRQIQSLCFSAVERSSVCYVTRFGHAAIRVRCSVRFWLRFGGSLVMPRRCSMKCA